MVVRRQSKDSTPFLERPYVGGAKNKPLARGTPVAESIMPVAFDAEWVIRHDRVDQLFLFRESNPDLSGSTEYVGSSSNLVPLTHADEVHVADS